MFAMVCLLPFAFALPAVRAQAQVRGQPAPEADAGAALVWAPRTGDAWLDARLADINRYAARYPDAFVAEIVRYHDTPRNLASALAVNRGWTPADVYMACALAEVSGRSCRDIAADWRHDHVEGWEAVAKRADAAPGSDAFERLRRGVVHSYDRWNRPLELDASLRRAFARRDSRPYR